MSRTLFDRTFAPRPTNRKSLGTIVVSVMLHVAAVAALVVWQLASPATGPDVVARLEAYVLPPSPKPLEPPRTPPPPKMTPAAPVDSRAPTTAPDVFTPEPEFTPSARGSSVAAVPTGGDVGVSAPDLARIGTTTQPVVLTGPPPRKDPIRVGGQVRQPDRIAYVAPIYPQIARNARVEGDVLLEATIDASGVVTNIVVRASVPFLDRAAIDAVSKWRYRPTLLNGEAVPVIMLVSVHFTLH